MMRSLNPSLLIILTLFSSSFCYDLKCARNVSGGTDDLPVTVSCVVFDLVIRPGKPITSINGNTDLDALESYNELIISHQKVKFIPPNIATFFPQLEKLEISNSGLEWIEEADINEFTSLRELNLDNNNLAILVKGLFAFNTELETISIRDNKLIFVHHRIFYDLTNLQTIDLNGNLCTKSSYKQLYTSDRPTFLAEDPYGNRRYVEDFLESNCQSWEAAYDIYYTMSTEWYSDLDSESDKQIQGLTHQLKTCDRNLDAALTNFEQQKSLTSTVVNKPDDLPAINLSCENELCVAVDFKVSFANSSIQSELYKTQRIMSLKIYQQPTLFLPQNLDEHFPKLINLSVTESGLYEIDFTVFEGLDLSSLNLTGNRIHEIPVDTFADLNNLQVLDLSFNKINSLFDDTFTSLKSLQQLYLNNNYLTSIQIEIFRNLESLTGLYLQGNQLKFIGATVLTPLTSLESVDLLGNACINMSHPTSSLVDIEATIIDNCIAPIELSCKSYRIETNENVENISYCNVEDLLIEYPKTKISTIQNREQELLEFVKIFFVDSQPIKFFPFQLSQHFPNLKRIEIQQSNLTALLPTDFDGFLALTEIVINNNNLSSISGGTFDTVPQLELLDLSSNGITTLPQDIFARLTRLHTLNLADNQIVRFMAEFLPRKNVIDIFRIDHNRLEFIEAKIIRYIRRAKLIDFTGNVCIDMQFDKIESKPRTLAELSGEIDLSCSAKD